MANTVSIAACNFAVRPVASFDEFADHVSTLLGAARGADLVLFPELLTVELFTVEQDWRKAPISELVRISEYTEQYKNLFAELAKEHDQAIVAGSHLQLEQERYLNVGHLFTSDGQQFSHAKTHIFPAEANWTTEEGDDLHAVQLPFAKVGFNICYELEIPECAATLAEQGVQIIVSPSYTFTEFGFNRVRQCGAARAIENQVYVVHCCTGGAPGAPLPNGWARSSILSPCDSPWTPTGIIAEATPNVEMVVRGIVDLDYLADNRETGVAPTYRDRRRRADLYRKWPSHIG